MCDLYEEHLKYKIFIYTTLLFYMHAKFIFCNTVFLPTHLITNNTYHLGGHIIVCTHYIYIFTINHLPYSLHSLHNCKPNITVRTRIYTSDLLCSPFTIIPCSRAYQSRKMSCQRRRSPTDHQLAGGHFRVAADAVLRHEVAQRAPPRSKRSEIQHTESSLSVVDQGGNLHLKRFVCSKCTLTLLSVVADEPLTLSG